MLKIDDETRLRHILDAAKEAVSFVQVKTRATLNLKDKRKKTVIKI